MIIIYNRLFVVILNIVCIRINVTAFFLVVRAVMSWKEVSWLKPFDDAGKALVDAYTEMINRLWSQIAQRRLALKGKLLIGLLLLELSRNLRANPLFSAEKVRTGIPYARW